jgi:formate--tetrahydrofolate ligase
MTTTIRALKYHGGASLNTLTIPNVEAVRDGLPNLEKHLENARLFNITPVIAINKFHSDSNEEIQLILDLAERLNVKVALSEGWAKGGEGALDLAAKVIEVIEEGTSDFKPLYNWEQDMGTKIETIAKRIYGADKVEFSSRARKDLKTILDLGLEELPVCIAKTQKSLSDDPLLLGRPTGFTMNVRQIEIAAGAGFLIPITGDMMRMPGLPAHPASENITIDMEGNISGLI